MEHARSGGPHAHGAVTEDTDRRRLLVALGLIVGFMAAEVVAGILANSLALVSDAAHMLTDAAAIGVSLAALRLAARPARGNQTFGLRRAEILSAQVNGATLLVLAGLIVYEAVRRLIDPPHVGGWTVVVVALAGVAVNLVATWQLAKANRENMAVEGSFKHLLTDLYAFIGTLIAGVVILATGFARADAIASLFVAALMLWAAFGLSGLGPRPARDVTRGRRRRRGRPCARGPPACVVRPRPARLGDRDGLPGALGTRPRPPR